MLYLDTPLTVVSSHLSTQRAKTLLRKLTQGILRCVLKNNDMTENELAKLVIDLCIKIHKTLGPGLLESAYEECLAYELRQRNISFQRQVSVPLVYDGVELGEGFRADIVVEGKLIIELKSVAELQPVSYSQLLTYLRLTNIKLGLLINFGQRRMIDGIRRVVNGLSQEK